MTDSPDSSLPVEILVNFVEALSANDARDAEVENTTKNHPTWVLAGTHVEAMPTNIYPHTREKHDRLKRLIMSVRDFQQAIAETNHILDAEEKMFACLAAYDQAPL